MTRTFYGLFVSFSGESEDPISNVYALTPDLKTVSKQVLGAGPAPYQTFLGLRGMAFGPDGKGFGCSFALPLRVEHCHRKMASVHGKGIIDADFRLSQRGLECPLRVIRTSCGGMNRWTG